MDQRHFVNSSGYITLLSVLIVSTVGIAVAISLILLGLGSGRTSFSMEQSTQTRALANTCVERALQEIRDDINFSGAGNIVLSQGDCNYTVINTGGETRNIDVLAQVDTVVRKIKVTIDVINPQINISSWQEVADL